MYLVKYLIKIVWHKKSPSMCQFEGLFLTIEITFIEL